MALKGIWDAEKDIQRVPLKEGRNISAKVEIKIDLIRESDIWKTDEKKLKKSLDKSQTVCYNPDWGEGVITAIRVARVLS